MLAPGVQEYGAETLTEIKSETKTERIQILTSLMQVIFLAINRPTLTIVRVFRLHGSLTFP